MNNVNSHHKINMKTSWTFVNGSIKSNAKNKIETLPDDGCNTGRIQDSRKEGARPKLAAKIRTLMIFMIHLINVRSNDKAVVVEKSDIS